MWKVFMCHAGLCSWGIFAICQHIYMRCGCLVAICGWRSIFGKIYALCVMCTHTDGIAELRLALRCTYRFLALEHIAFNVSWQQQLVPASFFSKPTWKTESPWGFLQTTYLYCMGHQSCMEMITDLSAGLAYILNCVWVIKLSCIKMNWTQMMNKSQLHGNKLLPTSPLFTCQYAGHTTIFTNIHLIHRKPTLFYAGVVTVNQ